MRQGACSGIQQAVLGCKNCFRVSPSETTALNFHLLSWKLFNDDISLFPFPWCLSSCVNPPDRKYVFVMREIPMISFINYPGLFFIPVVLQFIVTATVLSFTNVSVTVTTL
jgi:hypothetical protein